MRQLTTCVNCSNSKIFWCSRPQPLESFAPYRRPDRPAGAIRVTHDETVGREFGSPRRRKTAGGQCSPFWLLLAETQEAEENVRVTATAASTQPHTTILSMVVGPSGPTK